MRLNIVAINLRIYAAITQTNLIFGHHKWYFSAMNSQVQHLLINVKKQLKYLRHFTTLHKKIDTEKYQPIPQEAVISYNMNRYNGPEKYVCFAPFTNLFFDIRGKVVVCNQNRMYVLGDVHHQKITEIWNGEAITKIRAHLANNDFTLGCMKCADAILSKNYHGLPALSYDSTAQTSTIYPVRMEFEMGNTCNLACKMCNSYFSTTYKRHFKDDAVDPLPYPEDFAEQLKPFIPHLKYTKFTGGEPFLIDLYYKIWELLIAENPNCGIHIQTNGLVLNNKVKTILEKGKFYIGVSADGASKEAYEQIRIKGNFERLQENLSYFKDYCERKGTILNIPFTPTRETLYEVQKFPEFANKYNAYAFFNVIWEPHSMAIWTLDSVELKKAYQFHISQEITAENYLGEHNKRQYLFFIKQLEQWITNAEVREQQYDKFEIYSNEEIINLLVTRLLKYEDDEPKVWINDAIIPNPRQYYIEKFERKIEEKPEEARRRMIKLCTYEDERLYMEMSTFSHLW